MTVYMIRDSVNPNRYWRQGKIVTEAWTYQQNGSVWSNKTRAELALTKVRQFNRNAVLVEFDVVERSA